MTRETRRFRCADELWARAAHAAGAAAYTYRWAHVYSNSSIFPTFGLPEICATMPCHASELPFVFHQVGVSTGPMAHLWQFDGKSLYTGPPINRLMPFAPRFNYRYPILRVSRPRRTYCPRPWRVTGVTLPRPVRCVQVHWGTLLPHCFVFIDRHILRLARRISTGNPNGGNPVQWPQWDPVARSGLLLNDTISVESSLDVCGWWDSVAKGYMF